MTAASVTPTAGVADNLTITAKDTYGNTATTYTGSHNVTFGGASSIGAFNPTVTSGAGTVTNFGTVTAITFTNGVATVAGANNGVMKLYKAEAALVTVTDGSISNGAGLSVTVAAAAGASFTLQAASIAPIAGEADNLTVTALDAFGNTAITYTGSHNLTRRDEVFRLHFWAVSRCCSRSSEFISRRARSISPRSPISENTDCSPATSPGSPLPESFSGSRSRCRSFRFTPGCPTPTNAPTGVSMVLTGVLSKMGVYGFVRLLLPLFPHEIKILGSWLLGLAVCSIVFASLAAWAQSDLKRMVAYLSINHLGYCMLGLFAVTARSTSL